jgi:hypothetical protein
LKKLSEDIQVKTAAAEDHTAIIRLTALWALSEAALGGIMHLLSLPFTGLFVGGSAVVLIALIASRSDKPLLAIPRALLVVLIIKAMVSPHSPITAYIAVSFQGLVGALLFRFVPSFRTAALMLGVFALLESALQKLLTLTLLFGLSLWESLDAFIDYVFKKFGMLAEGVSAQGSWWVASLYVGIYLLGGLFIGLIAGRLPGLVQQASEEYVLPVLQGLDSTSENPKQSKPIWRKSSFQILVLIVAVMLFVYGFIPASRQFMAPLYIVARVVGLLLIWYLILAPFLMRILQRFLDKKASDYREDVSAALSLQPVFKGLVRSAWRETSHLRGWKRWEALVIRIITYVLVYSPKEK